MTICSLVGGYQRCRRTVDIHHLSQYRPSWLKRPNESYPPWTPQTLFKLWWIISRLWSQLTYALVAQLCAENYGTAVPSRYATYSAHGTGTRPSNRKVPPSTAWTMHARNADKKTEAASLQTHSYDEYTHEKLRSLANTDGAVCNFDVNSITYRYNHLFNKILFRN
jgi:hypothetical protein